jgi:hypothetical protein
MTAAVPALPDDLLHRIVASAAGREGCRLLCRALRDAHLARELRFVPTAPQSAIIRRVEACGRLRALSVRACDAVDDELLARLIGRAGLERIDVSHCTRLSPRSLAALEASGLAWDGDGCWRMRGPDPRLGPAAVIELQVRALRDNSDEGIAACFRFASPGNQAATGPPERFARMLRAGYSIMLLSPSARRSAIIEADRPAGAVGALVAFSGASPGAPSFFQWELSRQPDGCWATDGVIPMPTGAALGALLTLSQSFEGMVEL